MFPSKNLKNALCWRPIWWHKERRCPSHVIFESIQLSMYTIIQCCVDSQYLILSIYPITSYISRFQIVLLYSISSFTQTTWCRLSSSIRNVPKELGVSLYILYEIFSLRRRETTFECLKDEILRVRLMWGVSSRKK